MVEVNAGDQPLWQQANDREIDRADKCEALQNFADVIAGRAAGTNTRNEAAVFAHVVGELGRIENDADVKEREQDDQHDVDQVVERFAEGDDLAETFRRKRICAPNTSAAVAGNASSELAKIGGMTPPELTRSGR